MIRQPGRKKHLFQKPRIDCLQVKKKYLDENEAKAAIKEAKTVLPEVENAYKPSGKTNASSILGLLLATPLVLAISIGVPVGLSYLYSRLSSVMGGYNSWRTPYRLGFIAIIVDIVIAVAMSLPPGEIYGRISRRLKNRNKAVPVMATWIITLGATITLFAPLFDGRSIAPINLTLLFIPLKWPLMFIAIGTIPCLAAFYTVFVLKQHKFCEETGMTLNMSFNKKITFDYAENALKLLDKDDFISVLYLPMTGRDHHVELRLFFNEKANSAYVELEAFFKASFKTNRGKKFYESDDWLIYSKKIDPEIVRNLRRVSQETGHCAKCWSV